MLTLAAIALVLPAAFHYLVHPVAEVERNLSLEIAVDSARLLRPVAALLAPHSQAALHRDRSRGRESRRRRARRSGRSASRSACSASRPPLIAWVSEILVGSIAEAAHSFGMTSIFVGVVVVAIIGNAAEHSTAVLMARKNRMDLALGIAIGSSIQIALFVAPVLVFASYALGPAPMDLVFSPAEVLGSRHRRRDHRPDRERRREPLARRSAAPRRLPDPGADLLLPAGGGGDGALRDFQRAIECRGVSTLARSRWFIIAAAALFSTGGAAIKGTALDAFQVAGFRSAVAALALALLLPEARRGFGWDLVPAAFAYAGTLVCFVVATKLTTSAAAIFLQSTAPIWILLLAPALLKEKIRLADLPAVGLAAVGLALVFLGSRDPAATAPRPGLGNLVALASGLFYALLMITLRRLSRDSPAGRDRSLPATVLGNGIAFAATLPFALPVASVRTADLVAILYLGVVQIGIAYWLFAKGLKALPALEVSLLVLLEPVLNPLWTWAMNGERPSALASAGGGLMIAALAARVLLQRAPRAPATPPLPD